MDMRDRIRSRLSELNITVNAAQDRIGKSSDFLKQYLMGRSKGMNTENLIKLAAALETTPEWLLDGRGGKEATRDSAEVVNIWDRIPDANRAAAKRMLESLTKLEGES